MKIKSFIAMCLVSSFLVGCSTSTQTETSSTQTSVQNIESIEPYTGINALEACEWGAENFPDAQVVRYTNNTSSGTFETNGGAIPAMVLYLAKELPLQTEGRYRLELYADGTLAKTVDDIVAGLKSGAFEMNCLSTGNFGDYTDAFSAMNIPFFFDDSEEVMAVLESGLADEMSALAEGDIEGVLFKGYAPFGFRQMTNNKHEITSPDDLNGLKMRILTDPLQVIAFEAMGASVTSVTYSELYTALQQGVVDGEENPYQNLYVDKLSEVQEYCTETNHLFQMSAQVISESFWNGLTDEDREIFEQLIVDAEATGYARVEELTEFYKEECAKTGMEIITLTDEQLAVFQNMMEIAVYPEAEAIMGTERWNQLNEYKNNVQ